MADLEYLITKANKFGAQGQRVAGVILPTSATQDIRDTIFITDIPRQSASDTPWYI